MKNLFLLFLLLSFKTYAGGAIGNGGDAVPCRPSDENDFNGYYSLDYLAQYQTLGDVAEVKSLDESLNRIIQIFEAKIPELAPSFKLFVKNLFNQTDASQLHFWEKSQFGLIDLKDENLISLMPKNCRDGNKVSIVQAVIRVEPKFSGRPLGYYLFRYVPDVVDKLAATNPVQLSFLIVHEWLWDLSDNVERNRRINYWLHSKVFETWSRDEVIKNLNGIGFHIPQLPAPVFNPEVCPADENSLKDLVQTAKARRQNPKTLILGYGNAHQGGKLCKIGDRCDPFIERGPFTYSGSMTFKFNEHISAELYQNKLLVRSQTSGSRAFEHFNCFIDFDRMTISNCSSLFVSTGHKFEPQLNFNPVIGKNCLRFSTKAEVPVGGPITDGINLMEYVVYFPTVSYR